MEWKGMDMSFISYLINGFSLGSVYAIIALGYTMVYGIAKMLNFAHGDVIMIGAYMALIAMSQAGLSPVIAVLIAIVHTTIAISTAMTGDNTACDIAINAIYSPIMINSPCAKFSIFAIP